MKSVRAIIFLIAAFLVSACNSSKKLNNNKMESTKKIQVIGNKFQVDFGGDFVFELNFQAADKMTWAPLKGQNRQSHTEKITLTEIRPNIYMIYWKEKAGNTIVHVEDFANGKAYTNIATPDGSFYNLNGPLATMDTGNSPVGKLNVPTEATQDDRIPVIGNKFQVAFGGDFVFELDFQAADKMTWTPLKGEDRQSHTENITMVEIRPNVYMIYWQEASGNRIVHVEDFANGKAYTNITLPDQTFYNLSGPLTLRKNELTNKEKVIALLNSFNTGDQEPVSYINSNKYIQHNLAVADGLAGFGEVVKNAPPQGFKANVIRAFQDGDYVFTHTEYDFFGPKAGFDVFRFEDGKIVEHWDNLSEITPPNPSGRTQFDGAKDITDKERTNANKQLVENFVKDVLQEGQADKLTTYINPNKYIQHNSAIADGLDGLGAALKYFAENGYVMKYNKVHKVLGEGNFVLTMSEGKFGKGEGEHSSFYDLFRVENNQIVEHWDIIETIPAQSEWKNDNGKF